MFRRKDVELLLRIKHLLYSQKFTIEGARKALQEKKSAASQNGTRPKQAALFGSDPLPEIRTRIAEILDLLSRAL